jgi:hypothetical protein
MLKEDLVLGGDIVSKFNLAIPIEMYMTTNTGFDGQKEIYSKFGLQMQNSITLVVSKDRWEEEVKRIFDGLDGAAPYQLKTYLRPQEGDLIWDPLTTSLYETKFCDHDAEFYALGKNYKYHLSCEIFQYAHEEIQTGIPEIDTLTDLMSLDLLKDQILTEAGDKLVMEECKEDFILQDVMHATDSRDRKWGTDYTVESGAEKLSVIDPFG